MFSVKAMWATVSKKMLPIVYLPFERPTFSMLYAFLAGILASVAAQLFITPPLTMPLLMCTTTLLWSALLFFVSSGMMVWISFEIEAFKEDFIEQGSPRDPETRRRILSSSGLKDRGRSYKRLSRLWRMWVAVGVSIVSSTCATILLYVG